ncbi:NAD(P)-dependent oxidoreductase [Brevibacterium sp. UCMA 11754]|uniref:NAD(P)-dependent oxidoreductase n=1 Tax=Brevibacterium sp. UCMA 11754 TaxID=2749198 RepID=UPI001F2B3663|nr:NAD(P)-dependent oxidoreductase [Brevibacterium sp. UCMA 11754]MCF2571127.1 NAD(P)-dependent oxidoreductase [Brevibacterium sp. UCMA 11754]
MTDVAFIGLGTMGAAMACRFLEAGYRVHIWNRSDAPAARLEAKGAITAESPAAAMSVGLTFSMLSNDQAVEAVFSEETLADAHGKVHVNMASVSVQTAREISKRHERNGIDYVSAPVLGRPNLARTGQLNIVSAGEQRILDIVEPYLQVLGKRIWRIGAEPALANLVKIGVNYNLIHALQALAESVTLMERGGVDGKQFVDILTDAAFTGSAYTGYGPMIADRAYSPVGFSMNLGLKDLALTEQAAVEVGSSLPSAPVLRQIFAEACEDPDLKALDWSGMAEITRRRSE